MKNGKKLLRWMKKLLEEQGLNSNDWLYVKNTSNKLVIVHRVSQITKTIDKEAVGI